MSLDPRPIAPLPDDMRTLYDPYAASCNPPRQAKRPRSDSNLISSTPCPPIVNANPTTTSKRRGRKPSTSSRAAREAQRKMNHSIIEKARRTKINDALATLRVLVPAPHKRSHDDDDYELTDQGKSKKGDEKEFKLDVLIRTVSFLQELTEKVNIFEQQGGCSKCDKRLSAGQKRKREDLVETDTVDNSAQADQEDIWSVSDLHTSGLNTGNDGNVASNTRLPSISSWLPVDLPFTPTHSPSMVASLKNDPQLINQLPSPPASTQFLPSVTTQIPPALTLPSPRSFGSVKSMVSSTRSSRHDPTSAKTSPLLSPMRTAEDESAASMLLHISSSSYRSSASRERSYSGEYLLDGAGELHEKMQPSTPSSMLGLKKYR